EGLNNLEIGFGNEKSINQMLAHHAVIFKPEERLMWVSANPYQLGAFVAYDLDQVFQKMDNRKYEKLYLSELTIHEDKFIHSVKFQNYIIFKKDLEKISRSNETIS